MLCSLYVTQYWFMETHSRRRIARVMWFLYFMVVKFDILFAFLSFFARQSLYYWSRELSLLTAKSPIGGITLSKRILSCTLLRRNGKSSPSGGEPIWRHIWSVTHSCGQRVDVKFIFKPHRWQAQLEALNFKFRITVSQEWKFVCPIGGTPNRRHCIQLSRSRSTHRVGTKYEYGKQGDPAIWG